MLSNTIPLLAIDKLAADLDRQSQSAFDRARATDRPEERPACQKGCAYCCHQLVPLTTLEAQRIADYASRLPRSERRDLAKAVDRQAERFAAWVKKRAPQDIQDRETNLDYLRQGIPCPFLGSQNECRVYPVRPLICRGHHALGTSVNCQTGEQPIKTIAALDQATSAAVQEAQRVTASLRLPINGGLFSTFAPMFRAALRGK